MSVAVTEMQITNECNVQMNANSITNTNECQIDNKYKSAMNTNECQVQMNMKSLSEYHKLIVPGAGLTPVLPQERGKKRDTEGGRERDHTI